MASSASRRKPRQRHRSPNPDTALPPSQTHSGTSSTSRCNTPSSSISNKLGNLSKVYAFLGPRQVTEASEKPVCTQQPSSTQSTSPSPLLLFHIPDHLMREAIAGKYQHSKTNAMDKAIAEVDNAAFPPSPSAIPTSSDSVSTSSNGDFDPVDLEQNGGAGLSDITTPPLTPPAQTEALPASPDDTFSAGERFFKYSTGKASHLSSKKSFSDRLLDTFGDHDRYLQENFPSQYNEGTHVFVDGSNATIAFYNYLKQKINMPKDKMLPSRFNWGILQRAIERNRKVTTRFVVGSKKASGKAPHYFNDAEKGKYIAHVLDRVPAEQSQDIGSGSDDVYRPIKYREQGVDEILQLRMCDSIIDFEPGVLVLVTGDGNENPAGHSEGFPSYVQKALQRGWVVEVYSFKNTSHSCWRSPGFLDDQQWLGRYSYHHLDNFAFDMWDPRYQDNLAELASKYSRSSTYFNPSNLISKRGVNRSTIQEWRMAGYETPTQKSSRPLQPPTTNAQGLSHDNACSGLGPSCRTPSPPQEPNSALPSSTRPTASSKSFTASGYQQRLMENRGTYSTFRRFEMNDRRQYVSVVGGSF